MKASNWEFNYRALVFGLVFAIAFPLYAIDQKNLAQAAATIVAPVFHLDPDRLARLGFALGALLLVIAAWLRTWASSYLHSDVVYAAEVKTESLVADGPYRHVRNPLYLANIMMALAMGTLMSRLGFLVALSVTVTFCYRLILREEAELVATQGERYRAYLGRVPRLWPSLRARVSSSAERPEWFEGFKAELWYWGFAAALIAFAVTLKFKLFFVMLAASIALFSVMSRLMQKKSGSGAAGS